MNRNLAKVTFVSALLGLWLTVANADGSGTIVATVRVEGGVTIELNAPKQAFRQGEPFEVKASITNQTDSELATLTALLHGDTGQVVINRGDSRTIHYLGQGKSAVVSWTVCAERTGAFVFVATLNANGLGGSIEVESSLAIVAEVGKQGGRHCPPGFESAVPKG